MDDNTLLRTSALAALWGVSERQARNILAQLEGIGFQLAVDFHGARQLSLTVAAAAKAARQAGAELCSLRERPDLKPYLRADASPAADPLTDLIELRTELGIVREVVAQLLESLKGGSNRYGYREPSDWHFLGLPNPRRGL